jgi:hypothetical protein
LAPGEVLPVRPNRELLQQSLHRADRPPGARDVFFDPIETAAGRVRAMVRQWERVNVTRLLIQVPGVVAIMFAVVAA